MPGYLVGTWTGMTGVSLCWIALTNWPQGVPSAWSSLVLPHRAISVHTLPTVAATGLVFYSFVHLLKVPTESVPAKSSIKYLSYLLATGAWTFLAQWTRVRGKDMYYVAFTEPAEPGHLALALQDAVNALWLGAIVPVAMLGSEIWTDLDWGGRAAGIRRRLLGWGLALLPAAMATIAKPLPFRFVSGGDHPGILDRLVSMVGAELLGASVLEEMVFRAFLFVSLVRILRRFLALRASIVLGATVASTVFGLAHTSDGWAVVGIALAAGLVFSTSVVCTRGLWAAILGHAFLNLVLW